jgi:uncharacterized protein YfdQ (DUF2303 family)
MTNTTNNITHPSDAEAIIRETLRLAPLETRTLEFEGQSLPYLATRKANGDIETAELSSYVDLLRSRPQRREGLTQLESSLSLVNFAKRYKGPTSTLWAHLTDSAANLKVVVNDHEAGAEGKPEFGDFTGSYDAQFSKEWREWTGSAGRRMSQGEFAEWIEERLPDLTGKPTHPRVLEVFDRLELEAAPPAQLLQVSRGLRVQVTAKVHEAKNLSSGETEVVYGEEHAHSDKTGNRIRVPSAFVIRIPVFDHDEPVEAAAFLRYSLEGGSVKWLYRLHRPHLAREERFMAMAQTVATDCDLPLFYGVR